VPGLVSVPTFVELVGPVPKLLEPIPVPVGPVAGLDSPIGNRDKGTGAFAHP